MIVTRTSEEETAETKIKLFSARNTIFIQNMGNQTGEIIVYDMLGRAVKRATFAPYGITTVQPGGSGAYVVKAATGVERVTKKVIIGE